MGETGGESGAGSLTPMSPQASPPGPRSTPSGRERPPAAPTVHDVARLAGVSPMTVSRAVGGSKHVAADTRARVLRAANELGYVRNENARSIRPGQRTGLLGVVITNIENPYYAGVLLGVEEVAGRGGRRILVGMSHGEAELERTLVDDFVGRKVEGLVVVPAGGESEHLSEAGRGGLPLVLASRGLPGLGVDTVLVDDVTGARQGTSLLLEQGRRRLAFLGNVESVSTAERRYEGFLLAHQRAGVGVDPSVVVRDRLDADEAESAAEQMLAGDDPPDGYFAANNRIAVGALRALLRAPREPGADVPPLVSFDDFEFSGALGYPVSVIDHDPRELGRTAARMLLEQLDGEVVRSAHVVALPATLR